MMEAYRDPNMSRNLIAESLAKLVTDHCMQSSPPSDAILLVSDYPLELLHATRAAILARGEAEELHFGADDPALTGTSIATLDGSIIQILPYCIDEDSEAQTLSQGYAGKLRDNFPYLQPKPAEVRARWLVLLGKPAALDLDTFVTTTQRSRFTQTDQPGSRTNVLQQLRKKAPAIADKLAVATELYLSQQRQLIDDTVLGQLVRFYQDAEDWDALCQALPWLGFIPDAYPPYLTTTRFRDRLSQNQSFAEGLADAFDSSDDLDAWFDGKLEPELAATLKAVVWQLTQPSFEELLRNWPEHVTFSDFVKGPADPKPSPSHEEDLSGMIKTVELTDASGDALQTVIPEKLCVLRQRSLRLEIGLDRPLQGEEELRIFVNDDRVQVILGPNDRFATDIELSSERIGELIWIHVGAYPTPRAWNTKPRDVYDLHCFLIPEDQKWIPLERNFALSEGAFDAGQTVEISVEALDGWEGETTLQVEGMSRRRRWPLFRDIQIRSHEVFSLSVEELRRAAQKEANQHVDIDRIKVDVTDGDHNVSFEVALDVGRETLPAQTIRSVPEAILVWMLGGGHSEPGHVPAEYEFVYRFQRDNELDIKIGSRDERLGGPPPCRVRIQTPWLYRKLENDFLRRSGNPLAVVLDDVDEEAKSYSARAVDTSDEPNWRLEFGDMPSYSRFMSAREKVFQLLLDKMSEAKVDTLVALTLGGLAEPIERYAEAYFGLLSAVASRYSEENAGGPIPECNSLMFIDAVLVPSGRGDTEPYSMVLVAPTHPLRLLFLLRAEQLVTDWLRSGRVTSDSLGLFPPDFEQISAANMPLFLCDRGRTQPIVFAAGPPPNYHWGMLLPFEDRLLDDYLSDSCLGDTAERCLFPNRTETSTSSLASAIRSRINAFLEAYPYLSHHDTTVLINAFNPGTGEDILAALQQIIDSRRDESPSFFVRMIDLKDRDEPVVPEPTIGSAFDTLFTRLDVTQVQRLVRSKLTYSVVALSESDMKQQAFPEQYYAHLHFVADLFRSRPSVSRMDKFPASVILDGLIEVFDLEFSVADSLFYGGLWYPVRDAYDGTSEPLLQGLSRAIARLVAAEARPPLQDDHALYTELGFDQASKERILPLHRCGIWVCFLDRDVGIEGFDFPQLTDGAETQDIFLLDYTRKYEQELGGYDLITTTQKIDSVRSIIQNHLSQNRYGLSSHGEQTGAQKILARVNALSGRWGMSLINMLPNEIGGICGNAVVFLHLELGRKRFQLQKQNGSCSLSILLPTDEYLRVTGKDGRPLRSGWRQQSPYKEGKCSDDLLELRLTALEDGRYELRATIIEVKHGVSASNRLEEAIEQVANANRILTHRFVENWDTRIDRPFRQAELARLISFHGTKLARHQLYGTGGEEREARDFLHEAASAVQAGRFSLSFKHVCETGQDGAAAATDGVVALVDVSEQAIHLCEPKTVVENTAQGDSVELWHLPAGYVRTLLELG